MRNSLSAKRVNSIVHNLGVRAILVGMTLVVPSLVDCRSAHGVPITWDNGAGGGDLTWATNANWNPDSAASGNDITFNDTASAAAAATVTNIVSSSVSVNSLTYVNDNGTGTGVPPAKYHNTQINLGQTLTVNGNLIVGQANFVGTTATIRGASPGVGTLTVNGASATIHVNPGGAFYTPNHTVLLDMSSLGAFNANVNTLRVGTGDGGLSTILLAATNNITANEVTVGLNGWNGGGTMRLGQTNFINTDLLRVSSPSPQSGFGTLNFNTGLSNPTVQIRAKDGSSRVPSVQVGAVSNTSGGSPGIMNFDGGIVDALFSTVQLGIADASGLGQDRSSTGTLQFNAGTVDATTINMSTAGPFTSPNPPQRNEGIITLAGTGILIADTINMTVRGAGSASNTTATVNLGGTAELRALSIQRGAALGTGTSTINFNWNAGTIGNKTGGNLVIAAQVPLQVLTTGTHTFDATTGQSITVNSNMGGAGTGNVVKTGNGALYLNGTNTYVGNTIVNGGTLGGNGSLAGSLVVNGGGTVAPGTSAGIFSVLGSVSFASGSTLRMEVTGPNAVAGVDYDRLAVSGAVSGLSNADLVVDFSGVTFDDISGDVLTLVTTVSNLTGASFNSVTYNNAPFFWATVNYGAGFVSLSNFSMIPEPSTATMLGLGLVGFAVRHRRRKRAA